MSHIRKEKQKMKVIYPDYLKQFQCSGKECPDTCCKGWGIQIDRKTWKKYQEERGMLGKQIRKNVNKRERTLKFQEGACNFLTKEGLCGLQQAKGAEFLCKTCREYPRHLEIYGEQKEWSLSLSCPEVAKLILTRERPIAWLAIEKDVESNYKGEVEEELVELYYKMREWLVEVIQEPTKPIAIKVAEAMALAHDFQKYQKKERKENWEEVEERIQSVWNRYQKENETGRLETKLKKFQGETELKNIYVGNYLKIFHEMEAIEEEFLKFVRQVEGNMGENKETIGKERRLIKDAKEQSAKREVFYQNLFLYFLSVYFVGGIYDGMLYTKVKLAVFSFLIIRELIEQKELKEGRWLREEETWKIAWKYARQLEHSSYNLERLEEELENKEAFSLEMMLYCVLA